MKHLLKLLLFIPAIAAGQSIPNGTITQGEIWTATQWNTAFSAKVDVASGTLTTPSINGVTVSGTVPSIFGTPTVNQCAYWYSVTQLGSIACGGGASTFNSITSGTNSSATMQVGTGASITPTGTGVVNANQVNGAAVPPSAALLASNASNQPIALTVGTNLVVASGSLQTTQPVNAQTGTTYAIATSDAGKLITRFASSCADTLPAATTTGYLAGYAFDYQNKGTVFCTITPTTSTINGQSSLIVGANKGCTITSDGTNYQTSACTALEPPGYTIATLPTCNTAAEGQKSFVTNGQTSPTFLGTVSTTGAVVAPVFCNGSGWVYY